MKRLQDTLRHRVAPRLAAWLTVAGLALAAAPVAAQEPLKLRLQTVGMNASTFPDMYARSHDLYRKHGLDVEFLPPIFNAAGALQMVIQGAADVSYSGGSGALQAAQQGRDVQIFGVVLEGLELKVSLTEAGQAKATAAGISEASDFEAKVAALKGMTLSSAATGSSVHMMLRYSLQKYGLNPETDVRIQPMGDLQSAMAALRQGLVDGASGTASSTVGPAEAEGLTKRLLSFEENDPLLRAYPTYALIADSTFLKTNPEAARRLLAVFADAKAAIRAGIDDAEIDRIRGEFLPDMSLQALKSGLASSLPLVQGPMTPRSVNFEALIVTANAVADAPYSVTEAQLIFPDLGLEIDRATGQAN